MPLVAMPDGTQVQMPDKLDPALAARLKAFQSSTPQKENPQQGADASGNRLGETASAFARPVAEAASGALTGIPDAIMNILSPKMPALPGVPKEVLDTNLPRPGEMAQGIIDKYSTAPTSTAGKVGEFGASTALGLLAGPRSARAPGKMAPGVKEMASRVDAMTPGQRRGGALNAAEQVIGKIPVIGTPIKEARGRAVEQWNISHLNEALKDAGGKALAAGVKGRDAIRHTYQELGKRYDAVLGKMNGDLHTTSAAPGTAITAPGQTPSGRTPGSFGEAVDKIRTMAQKLDPKYRRQVTKIIDQEVLGRFNAYGKASGESLQRIHETLRTEIEQLQRGDYSQREAGKALEAVRGELDDMIKRDNPALSQEYEGVRKGYAKYKTAARASNYSKKTSEGKESGTYTPAQRLQAIAARDKSKDKNKFSTGQAHGQAEAEAASKILGDDLPDSGTAGRLAFLEAMLAGPEALLMGHPYLAAGAAATPLAYSQPALRFMQQRAMGGGPGALSPVGGILTGNQNIFGAQQ